MKKKNTNKIIIGFIVFMLMSATIISDDLEFGAPFVITHDFEVPTGLCIDEGNHRIFIVDTGNHSIKYTDITSLQTSPTWTEIGYVSDRTAPEALNEPQGVAVDASGNLFVADTFNNEVKCYLWDSGTDTYNYSSLFTQDTRNSVDGTAIALPRDVAVAPDNRIFLLDSGNDRILVAENPSDTTWSVYYQDDSWGNPYGLDIDAFGNIFIADTNNHRVIKLDTSLTETVYGSFGTANRQFRHPRDVAVSGDGRMFVADTYNHRISILTSSGNHYRNLGSAPLLGNLQKIEVSTGNELFLLDSNQNKLIAYFGPLVPPPFDAYIRDYVGDTGEQPSDDSFVLSSPDILVRHNPDVDLEYAKEHGLTSYPFQQPLFERENYIYLIVHNRGEQPISNVTARLFWADPGSTLQFPGDWSLSGMYTAYISESSYTEGNTLTIPYIEGRDESTSTDGLTVVGPIVWRPPSPDSVVAGDGIFYLMARLVHLNDPTEPEGGITQVYLNNNIAIRRLLVTQGPFPVGEQDTLVVRVNYPNIPGEADELEVMSMIDNVGLWVEEVSYGITTINPLYRGPVELDRNSGGYDYPDNNPLIEMAMEVLEKLVSADEHLFDRDTPETDDDIDRVILVLNDTSFTEDWATTGHWPYEIDGVTYHLSVSIQSLANDLAQFAHGISHQFGLIDLYAHENVEFPIDHPVDPWDNMAKPFQGAHPLTWSKELATWVTSSYGKIFYIPRPHAGTGPYTGQPAIHLNYQSILEGNQYGAIAIGLTEGVTTFEEESHFYWVEARSPGLSNYDSVLPADGVIAYYANKLIPQGHVPIIIKDFDFSTSHLNDAVITEGHSISPAGTGIIIEVVSKEPDNGGYMVEIVYDPPPDDYNVYINVGDPHWTSPDIWVDNQRDGGGYAPYDAVQHLANEPLIGPLEEQPIGGEENRIFARVYNTGPASAHEIEVQFHLSAPYHTVGGEGDFSLYKSVIIEELEPETHQDVFVIWEPMAEGDPHNCVRVHLLRLINDNDDGDNAAQQNLQVIPSSQASPYEVVNFFFHITNTENDPQLVYFIAEGVPSSWSKVFTPTKYTLAPDEILLGKLSVQPPEGYQVCTNHEIRVQAWTPRGDTLIRLGGTTVGVQLRNRTELTLEADASRCGDQYASTHFSYIKTRTHVVTTDTGAVDHQTPVQQCAIISSSGCTLPPRPFETIVVKYQDPSGNPVYKEVTTDEHGCFSDFQVVVEGGDWEVTGYYPGDDCSGPAEVSRIIEVGIQSTGDQDMDGLPDDEEIQGDDDYDTIPNHLDPDSDGDGILDGDEPRGDLDSDGMDNVIDPDSDNDGWIDGEDPFPYDPGKCECSPKLTFIYHLIALILLVISVIIYVIAFRYRIYRIGFIAIILVIIVAVFGLIYCFAIHLKVSIVLVIIAIIGQIFLKRRISNP